MRTISRTAAAALVAACLLLPAPAAAWPALWTDGPWTGLWNTLVTTLATPWTVEKGRKCADPDGTPIPCVPATPPSGGDTSTAGDDPTPTGG